MIDFNKETDEEEIQEETHPAQEEEEKENSFLRELLSWVFPFVAAIVLDIYCVILKLQKI